MLVTSRKMAEFAKKSGADIVQLHSPEFLLYLRPLKRAGKKVVFDRHEFYEEQILEKPYLPPWLRKFTASAYTAYEKHILKKVDACILPCGKYNGREYSVPCRRTVILRNYPVLAETYAKYDPDVPKEPGSVCYVGGLTYNRGITHLIQAAAKAGSTLYLAGSFSPPAYRQELEAMPEYSHVRYMGLLDRQQLASLLQRCQVGICTLLNVGQYDKLENFPTKVYEYMSLGLPVILSRTPYNVEMAKRYRFGVCVDPENADKIAAAIRRLLDDPEEARRMGENGRRAVKEEFNWGVEEKKLLALYKEILNEK